MTTAIANTVYMKPGETVFLQQKDRLYLNVACQVLSINHDFKTQSQKTKVKLVTV